MVSEMVPLDAIARYKVSESATGKIRNSLRTPDGTRGQVLVPEVAQAPALAGALANNVQKRYWEYPLTWYDGL